MSYNRNFNNNFRGSNFTFRYVPDFPPPPLPPPVLPPMRPPFFPAPLPSQSHLPTVTRVEKDDQEFIKRFKPFERQVPKATKKWKPKAAITHIKEVIQDILTKLKHFDTQLKLLTENVEGFSEDEWTKGMLEMDQKREIITSKFEKCVVSCMDMSRRLLAKRTAKRLRLKRLKEERKIAKMVRIKQSEEKSRKIDENLQKIKDDILKAKQAEEAKLEADVVLREVRRQKHDAKKCLVKLDALLKLRKARQNTAKGRGETVSEKEANTFVSNVEKLKALWNQKLLIYEKEEIELNAKLAKNAVATDTSLDDSVGVEAGLAKWRELLFGDTNAAPQVDFQGDVHCFVAIRSQWDQYLHEDGTSIPIGWVVPPLELKQTM